MAKAYWILALLCVAIVACSQRAPDSETRQTLSVGVLPDENVEALLKRHEPLIDYLEGALEMDLELVIHESYDELVEAFDRGDVQLAWFGGFTFIQARDRSGAVPIATRDVDLAFSSVFLVPASSAATSIEEFRGRRFAFGSELSTSGHLMPRFFLEEAEIEPESFFGEVIYSGAHDRSAYMVRDGEVDIAVANASIVKKLYRKGLLDDREVRVLEGTPHYQDYVWGRAPGPGSRHSRPAAGCLSRAGARQCRAALHSRAAGCRGICPRARRRLRRLESHRPAPRLTPDRSIVMTSFSSARPLRVVLQRYAAALIISILIPLAGLLVYVLAAEHKAEETSRKLTLYHLRTETLARTMQINLGRLYRAKGDDDEAEMVLTPYWGRKANAVYQVRVALDEIMQLQRAFGSERYAAVTDRIQGAWDRITAEIAVTEEGGIQRSKVKALNMALRQLERLHQIESSAAVRTLNREGWLSFSKMALAGALGVLISGLVVGKIFRLMGRMARAIDEGTAALRESETRFRQMADNIEALFWIADAESGDTVFVNPAYERIWGRPVSSAYESPTAWMEPIIEEDRERVRKGIESMVKGKAWQEEFRLEHPDGSIHWVRDRGFPVRDATGKVVRLCGIAVDITKEKRAEEEVRTSEGHLRSLMESAQGFVVFRHVSKHSEEQGGENVFVSPSIREILGVSTPDDFDTWFENVHEEDLPRIVAAQRKSTEDYLPFNEEMRIFHSGWKEWRWIHAISYPVHDSSTGRDYFNGIIIDITDGETI